MAKLYFKKLSFSISKRDVLTGFIKTYLDEWQRFHPSVAGLIKINHNITYRDGKK